MKTQFQTGMEIINMIIYQKTKPFVPKYANYDYVKCITETTNLLDGYDCTLDNKLNQDFKKEILYE